MPTPPDTPPPTPADRQVALFFGIWSVVVFYDRAVRGTSDTAWSVAIVLCAFAVLARPRSVGRFVLLSAIHFTWYALGYLKRADMHWHLTALMHAAVLLATADALVRHRRLPTLGELHPAIAPVARWMFVIGLSAAGFAKLNRGYIDPATSCASTLFLFQRTVFPYSLLPDARWAKELAIGVSLLAELGSPMLLLFRRTRPLGFCLALGFFFVIGTNAIGYLYEFAGLFVAFSLFFASPELVAKGLDALPALPALPALHPLRTHLPLPPTLPNAPWIRWPLAALSALALGIVVFGWGPLDLQPARLFICRVVYIVGLGGLGLVLAFGARATPRLPPSLRTHLAIFPRPLAAFLVPLVLLAGEITPYIGLRHAPTMTMAANSALSTRFSDHLVVNPLPTWDFNRIATIRASSDKRLKPGNQMVWIAFANYLAEHPNASVSFEVDGTFETIDRVGDDPRFQHPSFLVKLLRLDQERYATHSLKCGHAGPGEG